MVLISDTFCGILLPTRVDLEPLLCFALTFSSTSVPHSPHDGQRPSHLGESAPHELQNHIDFTFAILLCVIFYYYILRRNSAIVIAVAILTLSDSDVGRSCGYDGINNLRLIKSPTSLDIPCPSFPITTIP